MKLTNNQISEHSKVLLASFTNGKQNFPVRVNFYLQKNIRTLAALAKEIEEERVRILESLGQRNETNTEYIFENDLKKQQAIQELQDLFELTQDVQIYTFKLEDLDKDLSLSLEQMSAILFMIDDQ